MPSISAALDFERYAAKATRFFGREADGVSYAFKRLAGAKREKERKKDGERISA